jgi:glycosyltransferase involved in cell wall biosynthesis
MTVNQFSDSDQSVSVTQHRKHIVYVGGVIPKQGFSGSAILYRHFNRLESSNWKISLISSERGLSQSTFPHSWNVISLPDRGIWWPPVREQLPASLKLRLYLWAREARPFFTESKPSIILTVLWDCYSLLAAHLSIKWNIPLCVIVHDDWELFCPPSRRHIIRKYKKEVLEQASQVLSVSQKLGDSLNLAKLQGNQVLLPIPSERINNFVEWSTKFKNPVLAYAGTIYPGFLTVLKQMAKSLESFGGKLIVIPSSSKDNNLDSLKEISNVDCYDPFDTNAQVIDFLSKECSCILVGYPLGLDPDFAWRYSFPSKLLEFSNLGLPTLILAPPCTALFDWVIEHKWLCYLDEINESRLQETLKMLINEKLWQVMSNQTREMIETDFNPTTIHRKFEEILDLASRNPST